MVLFRCLLLLCSVVPLLSPAVRADSHTADDTLILDPLIVATQPAVELQMTAMSMKGFSPLIRGMHNMKLQSWSSGLGEKLKYQWDQALRGVQDHGGRALLLVLDAYDVVVLGGEAEVISGYRELRRRSLAAGGDCRVFFNGERYCSKVNCPGGGGGIVGRKSSQDDSNAAYNPYKYLNSGAFIGKSQDIIEIFGEYDPSSYVEDQYYWTVTWRKEGKREKPR